MKQQTISDVEYSARKRKTKREEFLEIMDEIIPWEEWVAYIAPYYPSGKRGRPPKGIEKMLRMYLLQCWFNLSDEGVEDAIYDSYAMRKFVGIDFFEEDAPDATTLLKFRRLLEKNNLNKAFFEAINRVMVESGHIMKGGTIVDATIINAPSSTKNAEKKRDPEMHQTKKGNEWRFGMKCHVGVDAGTGLVHTIEVTPANTHDVTVASKLIRSDDEVVYDINTVPDGEDHFTISVPVVISQQLYAWVFGLGPDAEIVSPPAAVRGMKKAIDGIAERYSAETGVVAEARKAGGRKAYRKKYGTLPLTNSRDEDECKPKGL